MYAFILKSIFVSIMISITNISVSFSGTDLFKDISFLINPRDRIGLVGKNGVGKSTLLNIIAGKNTNHKGDVIASEGRTIGYLPQEIKINSSKSIINEALEAFAEVLKLQQEIDQLNKEIETRTDYTSDDYAELLNTFSEKHDQLNNMGGESIRGDAEKVLKGLGFSNEDLDRPIGEFSGGWQMRVELSKLLLKKPDLLLLDEPTNHLDIESILWLENFLINYPGAIMMVSHDKMFLDNITNRTIEIVFGKTYDYGVNYSKYLTLREERYEQQMAAFNNQQKFIEQQERTIERFRAKATKAKQAQSMMKKLDKLDRIEVDEMDTSAINFHFPPAPRSGDVVVSADSLNKSYGEAEILKNVKFDIKRKEKVAFVGKNGEGKTTMIKMIVGEEKYTGTLKIGHNVIVGYYAQLQEKTLDEEKTVYKTIEDIATGDWVKEYKIRGLLGSFLFGAEDIDKKVKVLSGGEKSRLALAKLLLSPINLLILDEPTNHLDISAKEVLKNALVKYDGALIAVSHDREFLQDLTDRTFEFKNKNIREHLGSINDFLAKYEAETFRDFEASGKQDNSDKKENSSQKNDYQKNKEYNKQLKKLERSVAQLEKEISDLETSIAELEEKMQDPELYKDKKAFQETVDRHTLQKENVGQRMKEWEQKLQELETLKPDE